MSQTQDALQAWRKEHGLSVEKAARVADVSVGTCRNWLRDGSKGPPVHCINALEAAHPGLVRRLFPMTEVPCDDAAPQCEGPDDDGEV